jgi:CheY-like chemotaxis protein
MGADLAGGRVLVVDDDRVNRMLLTRSLERETTPIRDEAAWRTAVDAAPCLLDQEETAVEGSPRRRPSRSANSSRPRQRGHQVRAVATGRTSPTDQVGGPCSAGRAEAAA